MGKKLYLLGCCVLLLTVGGCTSTPEKPPPSPIPNGDRPADQALPTEEEEKDIMPPSSLNPGSPEVVVDSAPGGPPPSAPSPAPDPELSKIAQETQDFIRGKLVENVTGLPVKGVLLKAARTVDFLESFDWGALYPPSFAVEYEKSITRPVKNKLKSHFERNELASLKDPELLKPAEPSDFWCADCVLGFAPHPSFSDEESRFVTRSREVYQSLWKLNPLNEQAARARKCALKAFQNGNYFYQTDMEHKVHRAEALYLAALSLQDVAAGHLQGPGRPVYEFCTGKDLLTGRPLSEEEAAGRLNPNLFNHPPTLGVISGERLKKERFFGYHFWLWDLDPPLFTHARLVSFLKPMQIKPKTQKE